MRTTKRLSIAAVVLAAAVAVGCRTAPPEGLIRLDPPRGWQASLERDRASKNDWFRDDPTSPLAEEDRAGFAGLDHWEPDERFHFGGHVSLYAQPERFTIVTTSGQSRECDKVGWVDFTVDGSAQRLQVYHLVDGAGGFFLPFMDATTGTETYPAGRYVDLVGAQGGPYVLDFNSAYNPSCAYGDVDRFACPRTPPENRLSVRIAAGERGFKETVAQ
ncbi:MAG: DUF1684 domain-containing protein [bacterium]|nr:DUF1684 domain-containing protein [bacterium]